MRLVLDTGILGMLCHPGPEPNRRWTAWLRRWVATVGSGDLVVVPEIADYELRRKLVHLIANGKASALSTERLDQLGAAFSYQPITTATWRRAAELWARARTEGLPTSTQGALDGDVLLAAQAEEIDDPVVVTTNRKHLARYVRALTWEEVIAEGL